LSHLNALENVILPMIFQKVPQAKRIEKAKELLTIVGLGDRMHHQPAELSGGERQRVAIARAFANDPDMVIADEPTGNLDEHTARQIIDLMLSLHKKTATTFVIVTHNQKIAEHADRVIEIHNFHEAILKNP